MYRKTTHRLAFTLSGFVLFVSTVLGQIGVAALTEEQYQRAMQGELIDPMEARSQVYKSCADGAVDRWMLFWTVNIPADDEYSRFDFKTNREAQGLPLSERYGDFEPTSIDLFNHRMYFKVNRPDFLRAEYGLVRRDSIIVTFDNVEQPNYDATVIDVHRAPIVFLHGLASGADVFLPMFDACVVSQHQLMELMLVADYNTHGHIVETAHVVHQFISTLLDHAHDEGFFVSKVDVVGHSLGGLLARSYIQSEEDLIYQDDIHALICINTPHSGSEVANYVQDDWPYAYICDIPVWNLLFICGDVIDDLRTDSQFIDGQLNAPQLYTAPVVPARVLTSWVADACSLEPLGYSYDIGAVVPCETIFGSYANDGVVRASSQHGGLSGSRVFTVPGQHHIGAPANSFMINDVLTSLKSDPRGPRFSQVWFNPIDLQIPAATGDETLSSVTPGSLRGSGSLQISQPANGAQFQPGDTISFELDCSPNVGYLAIIIGNEQVFPVPLDTSITTSPVTIEWVVPSGWLGEFMASIIAFDEFQAYVADAQVSFTVTTDALPVSLAVEPDEIFCLDGGLAFYQVHATYSDGNVVDVTQSNSTIVGIVNGAAATIQEPGVVLGLSPDSTTMTIFHEGLVATVDLYVYASDTINIDNAEYAADERFFCDGDAVVQFYDLSGGTPDSIRWSFPGGIPVTSTEPQPTVNYSAIGEYAVQLIAHYGIYSDTLLVDSFIVVNAVPVADIELVDGVLVCNGEPAVQYTWYLDGEVLTNGSAATLTPTISGEYFVELTATNGCSAVSEPIYVTLSTAIVEPGTTHSPRLYPNPVENELWVESAHPILAYQVTNVMGEVVLNSGMAESNRFNVPLGKLCPGAYALRVLCVDHGTTTLRFVKE